MKYISLDTEFTHLDPSKGTLLQIGAILEDTEKKLPYDELPKIELTLLQEDIKGEPIALGMNHKILSDLGRYKILYNKATASKHAELDKQEADELSEYIDRGFCSIEKGQNFFHNFLRDHDILNGINVAGKNVQKDIQYIDYHMADLGWRPDHRLIDPSMLFVDWSKKHLPGLGTCKRLANIEGEVTHTALSDAWDVIQLLRTKY